MTIKYFNYKEQTDKNKKVIAQILYNAFETKFKPIFKKLQH